MVVSHRMVLQTLACIRQCRTFNVARHQPEGAPPVAAAFRVAQVRNSSEHERNLNFIVFKLKRVTPSRARRVPDFPGTLVQPWYSGMV